MLQCQVQFTPEMKVYNMNSEICELMKQPWLQLMCCAIYLSCGCNFQWKEEVQNGVSTDWCIAIEHQRSSLIEVIFIDYQTSELQFNYQSYIQIHTIGDVWGFSGIALITLSGGFSVETLTGVGLCHRRPSQIGVSLLQKTESPDCCTNTIQVCCKKGGLFWIRC